MTLLNPKNQNYDHLDSESKNIMKKTIDFFERRGKKRLKSDYHK
ncbi:MAG: acyl-CoA dehydrogenase, partial [Deltaproteobacteria bacterium]